MTARKVHFDWDAPQTYAFCGALPRQGAQPLELSERRKDVTCVQCIKGIAAYDAEHPGSLIIPIFPGDIPTDNLITAIVETHDDFEMNPKILDLADRHDLDYGSVDLAIADGWLKI